MSVHLNAGKVVRKEYFLVNPEEILVDEEVRGRHKPPTEETINEMVESLMTYGQKQPISVRRVLDKKIQVIFGFTRLQAAIHIRKNVDPEFMIQCILSEKNATESFIDNVIENIHRKQTSPIDDAHNQRRMRDQHGKTDEEIATIYRATPAWIGQLKNLLQLPGNIQEMVHLGTLPVSGAFELVNLPEAEQGKVIAEATKPSGKVNGSAIKAMVRQTKVDKGQSCARSVREIRKFHESLIEETANPAIKEFSRTMLSYIKGKKTDKQLENALVKLSESEPAKV